MPCGGPRPAGRTSAGAALLTVAVAPVAATGYSLVSDDFSTSDPDHWSPTSLLTLSALVETLGLCFVLWCLVSLWRKANKGPIRIVSCVATSMVFRIVWELNHYNSRDDLFWMRFLSRAAMLVQLSAVSLLMLGWASVVFRARGMAERMPRLVRAVLLTNILFYVVVLGNAMFVAKRSAALVHAINSCVVAFFSTALSCALLLWSARLFSHIRDINVKAPPDDMLRLQHASRRVMTVGYILAACFFIRSAAYVFLFLNGKWILYPFAYYQIPELIPHLTIVLAVTPEEKKWIVRNIAHVSPVQWLVTSTTSATEKEITGNPLISGTLGRVLRSMSKGSTTSINREAPVPSRTINSPMIADLNALSEDEGKLESSRDGGNPTEDEARSSTTSSHWAGLDESVHRAWRDGSFQGFWFGRDSDVSHADSYVDAHSVDF